MYNTINVDYKKNAGYDASIKGLQIMDHSAIMGSFKKIPHLLTGDYYAVIRGQNELERQLEILGIISRLEAGARNPFRETRELVFSKGMIEGYPGGLERFKKRYYKGLAAIPRAVATSYKPKRKPEKIVRKALKKIEKEYPEFREFGNYIENHINHMIGPIKRNWSEDKV